MSKHTPSFAALAIATVVTAVTALAFAEAPHTEPAAPIVKLERVVIVGKATRAEATVIAQLPRVVVHGYSEATLLRQNTLAAAKTTSQHI